MQRRIANHIVREAQSIRATHRSCTLPHGQAPGCNSPASPFAFEVVGQAISLRAMGIIFCRCLSHQSRIACFLLHLFYSFHI